MVFQADRNEDFSVIYYKGNGTVPTYSSFHRHNTHELVIVKEGVSRVLTETSVIKHSGAFVIFYPSGLAHDQFNDTLQPYCRFCINFKPSFISELVPLENQLHSFFSFQLDVSECDKLFEFCARLYDEGPDSGSVTHTQLWRQKYFLALILNELAPMISTHLTTIESRQLTCNRQVHDICIYIREHCSDSLTLEDIARHFFISRAKLIRNFRSELDMSVNEYILNARMSKAKRLLCDGISVHECAEQCGFSTSEYFIKVFRRMIGVTPAKYRKSKDYMLSDEYGRMK